MNIEIIQKEKQIRYLMEQENLDALVLTTTANFAWFTCGGDNHVGLNSEPGVAFIVVTKDSKYIITTNIESARIFDEEAGNLGFEFISLPWYEFQLDKAIRDVTSGGKIGSDSPMANAVDVSIKIDKLRYSLTSEEIERYKIVGSLAGKCIGEACRQIEPAMTENQIAAMLSYLVMAVGLTPTCILVATDERIEKYRHPIPTEKKLDKSAMLVLGAKKWGLIASVTRLVNFGSLPSEIKKKHDAVMQIDAAFIANTRPDVKISKIFEAGVQAYKTTGYANEWQLHHQGGPTGYKGRDLRATINTNETVKENQSFAWNPSITGTKSEDTILAAKNDIQIITTTPDWPIIRVLHDSHIIERSDILIR